MRPESHATVSGDPGAVQRGLTQVLGVTMRLTPQLLALGLAISIVGACIAEDAAPRCRAVEGELQLWNGWPPAYRIHASNGEVYGLETPDSGDELPDALKAALAGRDGPIRGTFMVCPTGTNTSVPYDRKQSHLVRLTAFTPDTSK